MAVINCYVLIVYSYQIMIYK